MALLVQVELWRGDRSAGSLTLHRGVVDASRVTDRRLRERLDWEFEQRGDFTYAWARHGPGQSKSLREPRGSRRWFLALLYEVLPDEGYTFRLVNWGDDEEWLRTRR